MEPINAPQPDLPRTARHRVNETAIPTDSKGKAYTPLPRIEPHRSARLRGGIVAAIAVAAVVAGIVILSQVSDRHSPAPPPALGVPATQAHDTQVLFLSSQDLDLEATEQAKSALARGEVPPVLRNAPLETRRQIASGEQQLYSVRLMDFADEDGDAVSIAVNGLPFGELALANAGARLTIPSSPASAPI